MDLIQMTIRLCRKNEYSQWMEYSVLSTQEQSILASEIRLHYLERFVYCMNKVS